jgi:hypothetical protein
MASNQETWQRLLRDVLAMLALLPEEQVRVKGPGCVSCDLLEGFEHARTMTLADASDLPDEQRRVLHEMHITLQEMQSPNVECFNNEALHRPVRQQLRDLAADALRVFGWDGVAMRPYEEVQPGVWVRPLAETDTRAAPGAG